MRNYDIGVFFMKTNGGFLITKIKQLGDRIFERVLSEKNIDAFNGPQGRILYVLWQEDGIPIKVLSDKCGLAITTLTTMLERMEKSDLICRKQDVTDKRKTLLYLTDTARGLKKEYDAVSDEMGAIYYKGFTDEEILKFEEYLDRIRVNLEECSKL
jgi:mobile rSAM pair MarR family regulator